jgi:acyl dehydratase
MASNAENAYEQLKDTVGTDEGTGEWFEVTQDLINTFADATHDHQWIHVDPERAEQMSPWKKPIAHGFLTLSLLTHLIASVPRSPKGTEGVVMGVNYGFDKVRFVTPVTVGSRIRAHATTGDVTLKGTSNVLVKRNITVEIEGEERPALVAEWLTMMSYA